MQEHQLTQRIGMGLVIGMLLGIIMHASSDMLTPSIVHAWQWFISQIIDTLGRLFLRLLSLVVIPIVLTSLISGICSTQSKKNLSKMGLRTLGLYLFTTCCAVILALITSQIVNVGASVAMNLPTTHQAIDTHIDVKQTILSIVPSNLFAALAGNHLLGVITFAILFAMAIQDSGAHGKALAKGIERLNSVIIALIQMILKIAPVGVFSLVLAQFSIYGMVLIKPLVGYFLTVLGVLFLHVLVVHYQIIKRLTVFKFNAFLSEMRPVLLFAFATASSAATIPLTMKTLTQKLNISSTSTSFVVPLGATLNMDGTAIMQGVATVLIANLYHIPLTLFDHISIVGLATLASIGAAGIPSAGMITLAMILQQIGLPVEGIAMIIGIDRILDMVRTSVNVFGDACICAAIDHLNHSKKKSPTIR